MEPVEETVADNDDYHVDDLVTFHDLDPNASVTDTAIKAALNIELWRRSISRTAEQLIDGIIKENPSMILQRIVVEVRMTPDTAQTDA